MKRFYMLAIFAILSAAPVFAAHYNAQKIHVGEDVFLGNTKVSEGYYQVIANGEGNTVEVSLLQDGKAVAK